MYNSAFRRFRKFRGCVPQHMASQHRLALHLSVRATGATANGKVLRFRVQFD